MDFLKSTATQPIWAEKGFVAPGLTGSGEVVRMRVGPK